MLPVLLLLAVEDVVCTSAVAVLTVVLGGSCVSVMLLMLLLMLLLLTVVVSAGPGVVVGGVPASCSAVAALKLELMLWKSLPLKRVPPARSVLQTTLTVGGFMVVVLANA